MIELIALYKTNEKEIESLKLKKDICKDEIDNWGAVNANDNYAFLGKKQNLNTRIKQTDKIIEEVNMINYRINTLEERQNQIINLINKFDGLEYDILKHKYIEGFTLQQIALKLGYSEQYIRNKHAEIVKRIKFSKISGNKM